MAALCSPLPFQTRTNTDIQMPVSLPPHAPCPAAQSQRVQPVAPGLQAWQDLPLPAWEDQCFLGGQVPQPGAGFATWHGVALSPRSWCLTGARGAESRPISCALSRPGSGHLLRPAQPSRPGRNYWHVAECQASACREVVSARGRWWLVFSQPRELGRCRPGSGTKQVGERAPVNIIPYGHQAMQWYSTLLQKLSACAESTHFPEIFYKGGTERKKGLSSSEMALRFTSVVEGFTVQCSTLPHDPINLGQVPLPLLHL